MLPWQNGKPAAMPAERAASIASESSEDDAPRKAPPPNLMQLLRLDVPDVTRVQAYAAWDDIASKDNNLSPDAHLAATIKLLLQPAPSAEPVKAGSSKRQRNGKALRRESSDIQIMEPSAKAKSKGKGKGKGKAVHATSTAISIDSDDSEDDKPVVKKARFAGLDSTGSSSRDPSAKSTPMDVDDDALPPPLLLDSKSRMKADVEQLLAIFPDVRSVSYVYSPY